MIRFGVADSDHVVWPDLRCDRNVAGEVEVDGQRDELKQWHQIVRCDQWYVKDEDECFLVRLVDV